LPCARTRAGGTTAPEHGVGRRGASGLGRATAEAFAEHGARVVVLDLPSARERLNGTRGLEFAPGDVRDAESVQSAVELAARDGSLRVAVNCAGVGTPARIVRKGVPNDLEAFERPIDIKLVSTFNVCRPAAAAMEANDPWNDERGVPVGNGDEDDHDLARRVRQVPRRRGQDHYDLLLDRSRPHRHRHHPPQGTVHRD